MLGLNANEVEGYIHRLEALLAEKEKRIKRRGAIDMARGKYKRRRERRILRQVPIQSLGFTTRLQNLLEINGIVSLADLMEKSDIELLSIKGIGNSALAEIHEKKIAYENNSFSL